MRQKKKGIQSNNMDLSLKVEVFGVGGADFADVLLVRNSFSV